MDEKAPAIAEFNVSQELQRLQKLREFIQDEIRPVANLIDAQYGFDPNRKIFS